MVDDGELYPSPVMHGRGFDCPLFWAIGNRTGVCSIKSLRPLALTRCRRGEPSWTNALGMTALGFISASLGLQVSLNRLSHVGRSFRFRVS